MVKRQAYKRPYSTHYYSLSDDKDPSYSSHGACSSEMGAIRATVVRIFIGQYKKALVHDRDTGNLLYTIKIGPGGLQVFYGRAAESDVVLRRIK